MTKIVRICFAFIFSNFCYKLSISFFSTYTPYKFSFVYKITTKKQNYSSHSSHIFARAARTPTSPTSPTCLTCLTSLTRLTTPSLLSLPNPPTSPTRPTYLTRPTCLTTPSHLSLLIPPTSPTRLTSLPVRLALPPVSPVPAFPPVPHFYRCKGNFFLLYCQDIVLLHLEVTEKNQHFFLLHLPFTLDIGRIHSQRRISERLAKYKYPIVVLKAEKHPTLNLPPPNREFYLLLLVN